MKSSCSFYNIHHKGNHISIKLILMFRFREENFLTLTEHSFESIKYKLLRCKWSTIFDKICLKDSLVYK